MPIPTDWDGSTFCNYLVKWPNSALWRMILRGLLSNPSLTDFWDERTGDVADVIDTFQPTLDQNLDQLECTNMNIPVGTIWIFAGQECPDGWLWCNGISLNRADFPDLFTAIGTLYGSFSGTTFNLPDLRERVPVGYSPGGYGAFDTLGKTGGEINHELTISEMPAHNHDLRYATGAGGNSAQYAPGSVAGGNQTTIVQSKGGGSVHNNMQPYQVLSYIIRSEP